MERPERVVLIIAGAILNRMVAVLWIIAILSNVTAIQRVVYTYVELKRGWSTIFRSPDGDHETMGKDE
jgi:CDP-diacylglycerol--glycerol-3-phosphate 3-phosphatidyltransferase